MIVKKKYRDSELYFLAPLEVYNKFILGVCYQSSKVIYDAIKVIEHIEKVIEHIDLNTSECGYINDRAIDIFCYNNLYESFESNKFIYCNTNFNIDELE